MSDYTRTFATGELDGELRQAYDTVLAAQLAALDAMRPGVTGVDADAAARNVIDASDFNGTLARPRSRPWPRRPRSAASSTESPDTLVPGNVVTVEPGIYVSNRFGVRIEDDVIVTADGIENPVAFRKDLVTVS